MKGLLPLALALPLSSWQEAAAADDPLPEQVETIVGTVDDPRLPTGAPDALLVVDTYREMTEHAALVIEEALAAGFRLRHYEHDFARETSGRRFYVVVFERPASWFE